MSPFLLNPQCPVYDFQICHTDNIHFPHGSLLIVQLPGNIILHEFDYEMGYFINPFDTIYHCFVLDHIRWLIYYKFDTDIKQNLNGIRFYFHQWCGIFLSVYQKLICVVNPYWTTWLIYDFSFVSVMIFFLFLVLQNNISKLI